MQVNLVGITYIFRSRYTKQDSAIRTRPILILALTSDTIRDAHAPLIF